MERRHVCSLGEAESRLFAAEVTSGGVRVSRSSNSDVLALVVHPDLRCSLAKSTARDHSATSELRGSVEVLGLLALGLRSEVLLVLVDVAVEA